MARLIWDFAGDRRYETGIDRGVLYHPDGYAIEWNGLVSVNDNMSRDVTPYFHDGVKIFDHVKLGSYEGTLRAFTYPDELTYLIGNEEHSGVTIHDQKVRPFSLSYRTLQGDDQHGDPPHYKIHVIYNVTAVPADHEFATLDDNPSLDPFEFALSALPYPPGGSGSIVAAYRPIAHISIDSRRVTPERLAALEAALYGDDENPPGLLNPTDLLTLVDSM